MAEKLTDEEVKEVVDHVREIHHLWWALAEYLEKHNRDIDDLGGYDDMRLMDAFCKDHPDVIRVHVDDTYHCNSYLYIVPHDCDKEYMGATVIVVPQCCGTNNQFFLYPNDHRGMLNAMMELERRFQERGKTMWKDIYGPLKVEGLNEDVEVSEEQGGRVEPVEDSPL